jgi:hypothetical protein
MKYRPEEIEKMNEGPKSITQNGLATVTTYTSPVPIEFFPDRKITEQPSYLDSASQGAGALTTEGSVSKHSFENGKELYLIQYKDYTTTPWAEKYLVSETIPVGAAGERYEAGLDLATAQARVLELAV